MGDILIYILNKKNGHNRLLLFIIIVLQSTLIIGKKNIQSIRILLQQVSIFNLLLKQPFLYLFLAISFFYFLRNLDKSYKKRKGVKVTIINLETSVKADKKIVNNNINDIKQFTRDNRKFERTSRLMTETNERISKYTTSILNSVLTAYLLLLLIILIEPVEIKQYHIYFAHITILIIWFYITHDQDKKLTNKFKDLMIEHQNFMNKRMMDIENEEKRLSKITEDEITKINEAKKQNNKKIKENQEEQKRIRRKIKKLERELEKEKRNQNKN